MENKENYREEDRQENKGRFSRLIVLTNILSILLAGSMGVKLGNKMLLGKANQDDQVKMMQVEGFIRENYLREVDDQDLIDGKIKGMVASLKDPYSSYMTEEEFQSLMEETQGSFGGIGVVVSVDIDNNLIEVIAPIDGTPGAKAGLRNGDRIIEVNGKNFLGEDLNKAVKEMKGEIGTDVDIKVIRNLRKKNQEQLDFTLTREKIEVNTVAHRVLEEGVGYISISSFDDPTTRHFKEALAQLEQENIEGLIIDLRSNPGGLLNITAEIADIFLDKGTIVYTETRDGSREYLKSNNEMVDYPLVVLINEGSASASEILAGALKDRNRATLVGKKSFGKGVVQRLVDLKDGTGLKLTIAEYFTPNDIKIDGIGIEPDVEVDLPEDLRTIGPEVLDQDSQLQKALELVKEKIK